MRHVIQILAGLLMLLAGCAYTPPAPTPTASPGQLLGTWRLDSVSAGPGEKPHSVKDKVFLQFYPDGSVASWSAADRGEVSQGLFRVREGRLLVTPVSDKDLEFGVTGNEWWYEKAGGARCYHRRVRPDPLPGRIP